MRFGARCVWDSATAESAMGLRHFVHRGAQACPLQRTESPQRLRGKLTALRGAQAAGWTAELEVVGPDKRWIADVLASNGSQVMAIEVQWSFQTDDDYRRRTECYADDGVDALWLARGKPPRSLPAHCSALPLTHHTGTLGSRVILNGIWLPTSVENAVQATLAGAHRVRRAASTQFVGYVDVATQIARCRACAAGNVLWVPTSMAIAVEKSSACADCGYVSQLSSQHLACSILRQARRHAGGLGSDTSAWLGLDDWCSQCGGVFSRPSLTVDRRPHTRKSERIPVHGVVGFPEHQCVNYMAADWQDFYRNALLAPEPRHRVGTGGPQTPAGGAPMYLVRARHLVDVLPGL